jgi:hypothetical protein
MYVKLVIHPYISLHALSGPPRLSQASFNLAVLVPQEASKGILEETVSLGGKLIATGSLFAILCTRPECVFIQDLLLVITSVDKLGRRHGYTAVDFGDMNRGNFRHVIARCVCETGHEVFLITPTVGVTTALGRLTLFKAFRKLPKASLVQRIRSRFHNVVSASKILARRVIHANIQIVSETRSAIFIEAATCLSASGLA